MTYIVMERNVDGACLVGEWLTKREAIRQAQRRQARANNQGNPWGARYSVHRTYDHSLRTDCVYRIGGRAGEPVCSCCGLPACICKAGYCTRCNRKGAA